MEEKMEERIYELITYGLKRGLIREEDLFYRINVLAEGLGVKELKKSYAEYAGRVKGEVRPVHEILGDICEEAAERGMIDIDSVTERDLFDTRVMGLITPPPGEVIDSFRIRYDQSPKEATDFYYGFSQNTNYIRRERIAKDEKWMTDTSYGSIEISINLSKPEKDPKAIAAAGAAARSGYPACLLCRENEGYAGHMTHPARQNHRLIPMTLGGEKYYLQYSPYVYYNEHCIVLNDRHIPMKIDRAVFTKLFDFIDLFPHYMVGSNADLPIVGGSILSHDHFQGGRHVFPMAKAAVREAFSLTGYPDIAAGIVSWPLSVIRLRGKDRTAIEDASDEILLKWRAYSDTAAGIYAKSVNGTPVAEPLSEEERGKDDITPHNTITPIARMRDGEYEIDLVLRNNRTDEEHPWGIYHPTADLHHIKKENIGLIEVMGLAILPARLKKELSELERRILAREDLRESELTAKHADWTREWISNYEDLNEENIHKTVCDEVGRVFAKVLECAGVYKNTNDGKEAFDRFIRTL